MKRNRASARMAADCVGLCAGFAELVGWLLIGGMKAAAWLVVTLLPVIFRGLWAVLSGIGRGVAWVIRENREEGRRLDAERRERWAERHGLTEEEEDAEPEEEEALLPEPEAETPEEEAPVLPPFGFKFEGFQVEAPKEEAPVEEVVEDSIRELEDPEPDDEAYALLPGGSPERAVVILRKRLAALYTRKEKVEFVNGADPKTWAKYQQTKAWRGLLWDIEYAETQLELIERAVSA